MVELDLEMVNPELAKVVLDVARECDSRYCDGGTLKIPAYQIKIIVDGHEIEISNAEDLEKEEKVREELKKKIKTMINNDATTGYIKAYELCGSIDNEVTREIRYSAYNNVPYLSYQQKIDICRKYAEINNKYEMTIVEEIAELQYNLVKNGESFDAWEVFQAFRKAYELNEKEEYSKNRLMFLYNSRKLKDGVVYWAKIFIPIFENVYEDNIGFWGEIVFDIFIQQNKFDEAEIFLDKWEQNELITTTSKDIIYNTQLCFIESNRQRLYYLRKGYHFWDSYTKVICYDDLSIKDDEIKVALIKNKYKEIISKFRECLTIRGLYKGEKANNKAELLNEYINACEEEIRIIPSVLSYVKEIKQYASYSDYYDQATDLTVFKDLSICYQKQNKIADAIRVCEKGIELGYIDDGTKSGMYGRLQRLQKKENKSG